MKRYLLLIVLFVPAVALAGQWWYLDKSTPIGNGKFKCEYYTSEVVNGKNEYPHFTNVQSGGCKAKWWVQ